MRNVTVEKKMELMQQIRSRYQQDNNDMAHREKLLYGEDEEDSFSTLSLRAFLAVAVFALLVLSDRTGSSILGLTAEKCFSAIGASYEDSIVTWVEQNVNDSQVLP